jgi:two-component sensor histidine kinase
LIINELVSNALKHAFPPTWQGKAEVEISLRNINKNEVELGVRDNGVGIPEGFNVKNVESLGMQLVFILAEDQLGGKVELDNSRGTSFRIRFTV